MKKYKVLVELKSKLEYQVEAFDEAHVAEILKDNECNKQNTEKTITILPEE